MRAEPPPDRIQPGQVVAQGRYLLLEVLGRGGLATVFAARDLRDGSEVALKVLCDRYVSRPERAERLRREYGYAARIADPSVISVGELGTLDDGRPFFSMERVNGPPLSRILSGSGGLPFPRVRRLARALAVALDAVHQAGIVHRDVKPANVLVLDDDQIKLIDFGMAGDGDAPAVPAGHTARLTRANDLLGTHEYMAPEQVLKDSPRRSMDVFALGVVMYEMLSSLTPYSGIRPREYVQLQLEGDPLLRTSARWARIKGAPAELAELIDQCRLRDPRRRPADMQEVIRRLDEMAAVSTSSPQMVPIGAPGVEQARDPGAATTGPRSRGWWGPVAWAALPVAAAVALWVGWSRGHEGVAVSAADPETADDVIEVGMQAQVLGRTLGTTAGTGGSSGHGVGSDPDGPRRAAEGSDGADTAQAHEAEPPTEARAAGSPGGGGASSKGNPSRRTKPRPASAAPEPAPDATECARVIARARAAHASYRWPAVLAHTHDVSCWTEHEAEYLMIRTEALMEEGRWAECVRTGRRSSDPGVRRHAARCEKRLATITGTP